MADFTLLRFQDCSSALPGQIKKNKEYLFLWGTAILLLFLRLGTGAVSGSEGRWLAVANEMLRSGDWLHPTINGVPYFDKPLISYWLIAIVSLLQGGEVNEFSARLPSALAALLALGSVMNIAKRLFSERAALIAGWLSVSTYSFVFWGRLAEADMENTAFIIAAVAWYLRCREKKSYFQYTLFWTICAVGAQTKGLAAFVIPAAAAAADMIINKRIRFHLNFRALGGFLTGMVIYIIPFLLETLSRGEYGASGIVLVFRENILRAVNPWDHKNEPFWCYFVFLPRLLIPWSLIFPLAFADACRKLIRKEASKDEIWLFVVTVLIFLLFSASRSRRVYYILPIVPFCMIFCGHFLSECCSGPIFRITKILLRVVDLLLPAAGIFLLSVPILFSLTASKFLPHTMRTPDAFLGLFYFLTPFLGAVLLVYRFIMVRRERATGKPVFGLIPEISCGDRLIPLATAAIIILFSMIFPYVSGNPVFRSGRGFYRSLKTTFFEKNRIPEENVAFFGTDLSYGVFYLDLPKNAALYGPAKQDRHTRSFTDDTSEIGGPKEFAEFLKKIDAEGGAVIGRFDAFESTRLPDHIRQRFISGPWDFAPGVIREPETLTDRKAREEMEEALARGEDPEKSKAVKKYRKVIRKKMLVLVVPAPDAVPDGPEAR